MTPINQIIAEGKRLCEGAIDAPNCVAAFMLEEFSDYHDPETMKHLYSTLERAIEVITKEVGHHSVICNCAQCEFLASIEKRGNNNE